jgi:hypothetical protein
MSGSGASRKWRDVRLKFAMRHITDIGELTQLMTAQIREIPLRRGSVCLYSQQGA